MMAHWLITHYPLILIFNIRIFSWNNMLPSRGWIEIIWTILAVITLQPFYGQILTGISTALFSHVLATVFHPKCNTQLPECPMAFIIVWIFRCKDATQFLMKNKWQIKIPTSCEILWPTGFAFILAAPRAECTEFGCASHLDVDRISVFDSRGWDSELISFDLLKKTKHTNNFYVSQNTGFHAGENKTTG